MRSFINETTRKNLLKLILCAAIVFLVIRRAWISDDAFITLRTVDNFVNGYGLRWNIQERVQTFTHPLWMFLISFFYYFTREPFYTTILLSIVISSISTILLLSSFSNRNINVMVASVSLLFSRAFIDYSTSGLENPLSHLIIIVFFIFFLKNVEKMSRNKIMTLSLIASLGVINRMDLVLIFAPALTYILMREKQIENIVFMIIGQAPLILWTLFSIIYYGFPIPNTAYAKLPIGIPKNQIIIQGLNYLLLSIINDRATMFIIFLSIILVLLNKERKLFVLIFGCVLYLLYILWIGGDFMEGRFLTVPLVTALIALIKMPVKNLKGYYLTALIVILLGLSVPFNTFTVNVVNANHSSLKVTRKGIADERYFYNEEMSLLSRIKQDTPSKHEWVEMGLGMRNSGVQYLSVIGMMGYYAGPDVHIVDYYTLADPLRSKLPVKSATNWRIGHFERAMPLGYFESLQTGENLISDPGLYQYYEKIKIITRGKIFTWDRIKIIFEINTGQYDYLLDL